MRDFLEDLLNHNAWVKHLEDVIAQKGMVQIQEAHVATEPSESILIIKKHSSEFAAAVESSGLCPWKASECPKPLAVRLIIFPYTGGANVVKVQPSTPIEGPLSIEQLLEKHPEFKGIKLPFNESCYVWPVLVKKDKGATAS